MPGIDPQIWKRTPKRVSSVFILHLSKDAAGNKAKTPPTVMERIRWEIEIYSLNAFKKCRRRHVMLAGDK